MSYINICTVKHGDSRLEINLPAIQRGEADHQLTDGEEIAAAARLLRELDALGEGEALVVWKDIF